MKSSGRYFRNIVLVCAAIFMVNALAMYIFLGVNVLSPLHSPGLAPRQAARGAGGAGGNAAGGGAAGQGAGGGGQGASQAGAAAAGAGAGAAAGEAAAGGEGSPGGGGENPTGGWDVPGAAGADPAACFMTAGEVASLADLSLSDKLSALSLAARIGNSEADRIYEMAADGLTYGELEEIRSTVEGSLTEEDMKLLYSLLEKGKKLYADSSG